MFNKIKNLFKSEPKPNWSENVLPEPIATPEVVAPKIKKKRTFKPKAAAPDVNIGSMAKAKATAAGEPYVNILSVDIDPENINNGSFELDFNDKFVINLIKAGYKLKDTDKDTDIVDRWFHTICRNIVREVYEQENADPDKRDVPPMTKPTDSVERVITSKPLGNGRSEVS